MSETTYNLEECEAAMIALNQAAFIFLQDWAKQMAKLYPAFNKAIDDAIKPLNDLARAFEESQKVKPNYYKSVRSQVFRQDKHWQR